MPWSLFQRQRLARQRRELEEYFRNKVKWINPADQHATKVEVTVTLSNDKQYTLRVSLPSDFPNSCPSMIVSVPRYCLKKKNGCFLNVSSAEDHTLPSKDGCTQICHCRPDLCREWLHFIPGVYQRFNLAWGLRGASGDWRSTRLVSTSRWKLPFGWGCQRTTIISRPLINNVDFKV